MVCSKLLPYLIVLIYMLLNGILQLFYLPLELLLACFVFLDCFGVPLLLLTVVFFEKMKVRLRERCVKGKSFRYLVKQ